MAEETGTNVTNESTPTGDVQQVAQQVAQGVAANPTGTETGNATPTDGTQQSTVSGVEGDSTLEAAAKAQEQAQPQSEVPEQYQPFKDSEGNEYSQERLGDFVNAAKEAGLSQEKAQSLFSSMIPTARKYIMDDLRKSAEQWKVDSSRDPEIGGANFGANQAIAVQAYKQYATPELRTILNASGLGNHPEVIRLFYRIGKTMQQDTGVHGGASSPTGRTPRYPNSHMVVDE